ncbi:hypothetical protein F7725_002698 [Dissostichus mawsoni]|uniref:Uncharacterized protein n=1 Tax=Dissostichus mawsoni TaxID=36200 RepID=A0A7J5Y4X6_DISMA|nr:hypothetical protein F7725_002698 [Dissostichus mawsoni]
MIRITPPAWTTILSFTEASRSTSGATGEEISVREGRVESGHPELVFSASLQAGDHQPGAADLRLFRLKTETGLSFYDQQQGKGPTFTQASVPSSLDSTQ